MTSRSSRVLRRLGLALCSAGLLAVLVQGQAVARRDTIARASAEIEDILFHELQLEARRLGAVTDHGEAESILRARARYEAGLFARALADGMEHLDPVVEARLLELLAAELGGSRPTSAELLARARELGLLAHDPVIRRRMINKRMLWEG